MKLKGKFKEDFDKWYIDLKLEFFKGTDISKKEALMSACESLTIFKMNQNFAMQYGVIVDFADSVGIQISIKYIFHHSENKHMYSIKLEGYNEYLESLHSRHEARTEAVNKLIEIYNEK